MNEPKHESSAQAIHESQATATGDEELLAALADDFAARLRRGEHPTVEEYAAKHSALAQRIRKVLSAAAMMEQTRAWDVTTGGEAPGATIGRYKLLERIGEGGFGVVYMAEQQQPVRRKVALKVIKPGMDSRQVLARFDAERQALALMDHPNIAKIFDGGMTDSGRPYFVMELVRGQPITEFSDQHRLVPRARLELFAQVCHAVQHAHQKGIIHRDIKPSNVLVMMHDTTPIVKVIDFGVAKALGQELTDKTLFTGFAQFLGTPLYMSPEQAGESSLDVDTRSDIYSLGVLLYELLTGTTPFDKQRFQQAAQDEIRRIIREEEPPKPSTRLSESKESLASISALRQTEPVKLTKLVRGELDWIVMKALEKDRTRRYETATGVARDIERYLHDEPVEACPPSNLYRLKKFARRNKGTLATASAIGIALLLALGSFGWMAWDRSERHAKAAAQVELILAEVDQLEREQNWSEALATARRAEAALAGSDANIATARRVREQLKGLEFIDRLEQIRMRQATWTDNRFDDGGAEREYARAFRDCGVDVDELAVETSIEQLKEARPALAIALASALDNWARVHWGVKRNTASAMRLVAVARGIDPEPIRDRVRAMWGKPISEVQDALQQLAESIDIRAQHPATLVMLVDKLLQAKKPNDAVQVLRDAQRVYPGDFWLNYYLAQMLAEQKDDEGAIRFYTAAVSIRPNAVAALNNLGNALAHQKKLDEAIAVYRRAIEIDPTFAYAYNGLGIALADQTKLDEAVVAYRKAIELDPKDSAIYVNLGIALWKQKKLDESIDAYHNAIELNATSRDAYQNLSVALAGQGKWDEAAEAARKAIAIDPKYAGAYYSLGIALGNQKKLDEAAVAYRKAIELNPKDSRSYNNLGSDLHRQKRLNEAIVAYRKAIELDPKYALAYYNLGVAMKDQGNLNEATVAFYKAIELDPKSASAYRYLGSTLQPQGKVDEAISAYRKAIELEPNDARSYSNLGVLLCDVLGDYEGAAACFRKAIELEPNDARSHSNLGALLCDDLGNYEGAAACFRKAIELDPKFTSAHSNLGNALKHQGKVEEAIAAYQKAIELDPKFASSYNNLAWLLATCSDAKLRDPAQAVALAEKAVEFDPQSPKYPNTLGVAYYRIGNWKAAIAALEKSVELRKGGDSCDWFFLAMAQWQLGNKDAARDWYKKAVEWAEKNAAANDELRHFRAEAAQLLGVNDDKQSGPSVSAATAESEAREE